VAGASRAAVVASDRDRKEKREREKREKGGRKTRVA
jgi:hypothetical protein